MIPVHESKYGISKNDLTKLCHSLKKDFANSTLSNIRIYKECDDFAHLISIEQLDSTPAVLANEKDKEKEAI